MIGPCLRSTNTVSTVALDRPLQLKKHGVVAKPIMVLIRPAPSLSVVFEMMVYMDVSTMQSSVGLGIDIKANTILLQMLRVEWSDATMPTTSHLSHAIQPHVAFASTVAVLSLLCNIELMRARLANSGSSTTSMIACCEHQLTR